MKSNIKLRKQKDIDKKVGNIINNLIFVKKKLLYLRRRPSTIKKFMFFKLDAIGDSILSLPILKEVKLQLKCEVIVVCSESNKSVFEGQEYIDKLIIFNTKTINVNFFKTIKMIKKEKADVCVDSAQSSNISAILSYVYSKFCIGFKKINGDFRNKVYDLCVKFNSDKHVVLNYFNLVKYFGVEIPENIKLIPLKYTIGDNEFINKYFTFGKKYVGISPCNELYYREWGLKKYLEVIKSLINEDYKICLFGSKIESERIYEFINSLDEEIKKNIINLSGKLNWKQTFACMKYLDFFIGNDGAMCHIAASFDIPTVTIFGPETPLKYAPFNQKSISVWRGDGLKCCPCTLPIMNVIPGCKNKYCVDNLQVNDVIDAINILKFNKII